MRIFACSLSVIIIIELWARLHVSLIRESPTNGLSTETEWFVYTKVFRWITAYGEKCLKRILTYLDSTKYNEINISHSHIQKHVSYKKWYKKYKYYVYRLAQKFSDWENFLKHILTYLDWTKYNEINISHSHIQKHVSSKKWYKKYKHNV